MIYWPFCLLSPSNLADREVEIDLDVQRPGERREINGHEEEFVVTTVTVREKDRTLEEGGGIVMTTRSWTSTDVTGMQEVVDFQRRYAEALGEIFGFDTSAEQMTSAMAMFPGLGEAMKRFTGGRPPGGGHRDAHRDDLRERDERGPVGRGGPEGGA